MLEVELWRVFKSFQETLWFFFVGWRNLIQTTSKVRTNRFNVESHILTDFKAMRVLFRVHTELALSTEDVKIYYCLTSFHAVVDTWRNLRSSFKEFFFFLLTLRLSILIWCCVLFSCDALIMNIVKQQSLILAVLFKPLVEVKFFHLSSVFILSISGEF